MSIYVPNRQRNLAYWELAKDRVKQLNERAGRQMSYVLGIHAPIMDRLCIVSAGSDGRLEKGLISKLETILYHRSLDQDVLTAVDRVIRDLRDEQFHPLVNGNVTEIKSVDLDCMSYAFEDRKRVYPGRVLDSFVLYGNPGVLLAAKTGLIEDWRGADGRRIRDILSNRRRSTRVIMASGTQMWKYHTVRHYDIQQGIAYFNDMPSEDGASIQLRSFKSGPLRFVQVTLELTIVELVRRLCNAEKLDAAVAMLRDLPTPSVDKLDFLFGEGQIRLNKEDVAEVIDCYLAFLQLYHTSENLYRQGQTCMEFDRNEVSERITVLARLLGNSILTDK